MRLPLLGGEEVGVVVRARGLSTREESVRRSGGNRLGEDYDRQEAQEFFGLLPKASRRRLGARRSGTERPYELDQADEKACDQPNESYQVVSDIRH